MKIVDREAQRQIGPPVPYKSQFGQFSNKHEIPEGAVVMSSLQMKELVYRTITKWQPRSEMWSFTYGIGIVGGTAMVSGIYFNAVLRNKFKLRNFGPLLTFAPTVLIPCITTLMVQNVLVTDKMILRQFDCPTCAQIRSASLMVGTGLVQPCLLSLLSCTIIARYRSTVSLPSVLDIKLLKFYGKFLRPMKMPITGLFLLNIATAIFMTEQQGKAVDKVHRRLSSGF